MFPFEKKEIKLVIFWFKRFIIAVIIQVKCITFKFIKKQNFFFYSILILYHFSFKKSDKINLELKNQ